ncbi:MAG: AAA family ATPase [Bacteroidota bacterium]|nr:AAA family ATPase [Bacteroidota bacterium]
MKIEFVEIQNFRKLNSCRVNFDEKETIFVGANNSGKTSAMDALMYFLKDKSRFTTRDITLSNWKELNEIGNSWISESGSSSMDFHIKELTQLLPHLDIWLSVDNSEIHYISHIIPTLDWAGGLLGVRLKFEPKNIGDLYKDFLTTYNASKNATTEADKKGKGAKIPLNLWPHSLWDFLEKRLQNHFEITCYILDPKALIEPVDGYAMTQNITPGTLPLDSNPFIGLIKIDIINAQRGFSDTNTDNSNSPKVGGNLSAQLREYYAKHLDPFDQPDDSDIDALQSIENAKTTFDEKLKISFEASLSELESLNYPGFGGPSITISSKISAIDGLNHDSAIKYDIFKDSTSSAENKLSLPEKSNGLGYQNLISMVFKLIRFRDEWMQVGKRLKQQSSDDKVAKFEPLHLILIEEPEAHLHAQVQQVFIRRAYQVLRNNLLLGDKKQFTTQLIVSTHSNHIAHEIDFNSLRYFRRKAAEKGNVPTTTVINLSKTFGNEKDTTKFAIRYLKTTHCDLFFADAVILIEGPAERMLLPHFIKNHYPTLDTCYISILEIGGSHAHKLKPLIEDLGIITLIITDIDSVDPTLKRKPVPPERAKGFETGNFTLKDWLPKKVNIDDLFALDKKDKHSTQFPQRVAYQFPLNTTYQDDKGVDKIEEAFPYTFEDALAFENLGIFKSLTGNGMIKKFNVAANKSNAKESGKAMFEALESGKKAEFALELLYLEEPNKLKVPGYIAEGLDWLNEQLNIKLDANKI